MNHMPMLENDTKNSETSSNERNPQANDTEKLWRNTRDIPKNLEVISKDYREPTTQKGTLVQIDYETWESFSYEQHSQKLKKKAWVYLPYDYNKEQRYNIFYLSHGGWSNEETVLV